MTVEPKRTDEARRVPGARQGGLKWVALMCVWASCTPSGEMEAVGARSSQEDWIAVGSMQRLQGESPHQSPPDLQVQRPALPERAPAVQAWREAPSEESALRLARAYLPQLAGSQGVEEQKAPISPALALRVRPAATEGGQMELSTRGYLFRVRPGQGGKARASQQKAGALFYGARHFWTAAEAPVEEAGLWQTPRVDEVVVLEGGGAPYRASYEVELPEGIEAARDAGEYLEFLDGQGVPVVRLHYPVARDSTGRSQQGAVRLKGATPVESQEPEGMTRLALKSQTLTVEMEVATSELVGPTTVNPGWSSSGVMSIPRTGHKAALLADGKVLVMGGWTGSYSSTTIASAEVYDPVTGTWSATGAMNFARSSHTAVVLTDGRVLVAGGSSTTTDAEVYEPSSGTWSTVDGVANLGSGLTATLLLDGKVLFIGSNNNNTGYLFDPAAGTWTATGPLTYSRSSHTATLLPDGRVLVAGGSSYYGDPSRNVEVYTPETNTWRATGLMGVARYSHTATLLPNGRVLVTGGSGNYYSTDPSRTAEVYDTVTGTWSPIAQMPSSHSNHSATLLPDGRVLVYGSAGNTDIYNPSTGTWVTAGSTSIQRYSFTATLLPGGKVLVAGGSSSSGTAAELYDPAAGAWVATSSLATARALHMAALLPNGQVLVAGGQDTAQAPLALAERYDATAGAWSATGLLNTARTGFTVTLLPQGKVLVVGGSGAAGHLASAELYDTATGTWSTTGSLAIARARHTATLLPGGKVLVSGGAGSSGPIGRAELYDVAAGSWSPTAALNIPRSSHTATLLSGGRVLVIGGKDAANNSLSSSELYSLSAGRWLATASLATARAHHTATVLLDGRVLVAGGEAGGSHLASVEVYSPATGTFSLGRSLATARSRHTTVLMPDGRVLVAGGSGSTGALASVERYDSTGALEAWRPLVTAPGPVRAGGVFSVSGFGFRGASEGSSGTASASATNFPLVQVTSMEGEQTYLARLGFSDSSVTVSAPAGANGYYLLTVTTNAISAGTMLFVDGQVPAAPVITAPAGLVSTATPAVEGTAEAGSTVTVTLDGAVVGMAVANASGTWRFTPASALAQGQHTVSAIATDAAGNTGASSGVHGFTVDSVAPAVPVLTSPAALVNTAMPTVAGAAEAGSTVTVRVDGAVVGTATTDDVGAWSLTLASALAQGAHTATATATDAAGNTSASSAARGFTVDSVAPAVPVLTSPAALVNTAMPTVAGTAEAGSTVTVSLNGAIAGTVMANAAGAWSFTPASALAQGAHTATATATDVAGNTSAPSPERGFTVDSVAPAMPVLTSPAALVNTVTPTVAGTAEAGSSVMVMVDGAVVGTVTADASGAWSFTPASALAQGPHTAAASASDAAGNASALSSPRSFIVDSMAPAVPAFVSPTGLVSTDAPTFRGVAEAGTTVTVTVEGMIVGTAMANASGAWSFIPASPLAQGFHMATATATDAAGNTSSPSEPVSFTVDSVAPFAPVLASPTAFTNTPTPAIGGSAEAGSMVTIVLDGVVAGTAIANAAGAWNFTPFSPLTEEAHTVYATSQDAAGNTSLPSVPRIFTVDTVAPAAPAVTSPSSTVSSDALVIGGTAEAGSTVTVMVDGAMVGTATANTSGAWSLTPASPVAAGGHTAHAYARDPAGNPSPWSAPLSFKVRK